MSVPQGRSSGSLSLGPAAGRRSDPSPALPGTQEAAGATGNPWNALWAMMIGFFMILVDSTIVAVANPSIMTELRTDYDAVIWVTSAYLLAYAVPLLVAGRLGDQFGPKNLYLIGLLVFTAASAWCGFAGTIEMLIAARVVQGLGAALLTPQTLSTITRIFPAYRRGVAMSVWGATAGVATLVGPLAGGVLVDHLGWQWIFFVNVPVGIVGLALAWWLVPVLPTHVHRFDLLGVLLSGAAMFLIVFALQEGQANGWAGWIWAMIAAGAAVMAGFVYWQAVNRSEPLVPLVIFRDRNFSLSNVGVAVIGFVVTAMIVPLMFYAQVVCDLSPTRAALLTAPMAIATGVLAPLVGRIVDRVHPRPVIGFGFSVLAVALTWLSIEMTPETPIWRLVLPITAMGASMAFIWSPLAATATRNLPPHLAGAGSGVYNTTRQIGAVLGSAGIAAFMTSRIAAEMPGAATRPEGQGASIELPEFLRAPFSAALSQSMLLPAFIALFGVVAALFLLSLARALNAPAPAPAPEAGRAAASLRDRSAAPTDILPVVDPDLVGDSAYRRQFRDAPAPVRSAAGDSGWFGGFYDDHGGDHGGDHGDEFRDDLRGWGPDHAAGLGHDYRDGYRDDNDDDDAYVEFTVSHEPDAHAEHEGAGYGPAGEDADEYGDFDEYGDLDEGDTEPLRTRVEHPRPAPAGTWHSAPVEAWHSLLDEESFEVPRAPAAEPIGFAHNGFHVDDSELFQPVAQHSEPTRRPAGAHDGAGDGFDRLASQIDSFAASFADLLRDQGGDPEAGSHSGAHPNAVGDGRARHERLDAPDAPDAPDATDAAPGQSRSKHRLSEVDNPRPGRHYRADSDDGVGYGRHTRRHPD